MCKKKYKIIYIAVAIILGNAIIYPFIPIVKAILSPAFAASLAIGPFSIASDYTPKYASYHGLAFFEELAKQTESFKYLGFGINRAKRNFSCFKNNQDVIEYLKETYESSNDTRQKITLLFLLCILEELDYVERQQDFLAETLFYITIYDNTDRVSDMKYLGDSTVMDILLIGKEIRCELFLPIISDTYLSYASKLDVLCSMCNVLLAIDNPSSLELLDEILNLPEMIGYYDRCDQIIKSLYCR